MLTEFRNAVATHGIPASTLTDNGMVFTTRLSGGKGGRNHLETELRRLVGVKRSQPMFRGIHDPALVGRQYDHEDELRGRVNIGPGHTFKGDAMQS